MKFTCCTFRSAKSSDKRGVILIFLRSAIQMLFQLVSIRYSAVLRCHFFSNTDPPLV